MFRQPTDFDALKLSLASPEEIKSWSYGEVTKAETINYRTLKPEKDGLFDERIFGPTKDYECYCGKYKRARYKGVVCDKCGVEVTHSRVRRERMGHISLAAPVIHIWYLRRYPSKLAAVLNVSQKKLEAVIYYAQFIVTEINQEQKAQSLRQLEAQLKERRDKMTRVADEKIAQLNLDLKEKINQLRASKPKLTEADELKVEDWQGANRRSILRLREELAEGLSQLEESFKGVRKLAGEVEVKTVLSESEVSELNFWGVDNFFVAEMGAEAVLKVLEKVDLSAEIKGLDAEIHGRSKAKRKKAIKRLKILQGLEEARIDPTWMVLRILPVIPPELRPMVQLAGGRFATSDLNDLYRRVINRNNRLRELVELGAPEIILQNEKRMLQEAVDALIEGERRVRRGRKELQSLSEMLKGKQGRFRRNLLGKRVDYSGRSVIVSGPDLRIDQVGLPKEMALELFRPFVLRDLIVEGYAPNLKSAKNVIEERGDEVWDILERVTKDHPVLINRAPTLHRQNIQAFYPVLIGGKAIAVHPAVVGGFAGDFDGDAMSVHVPLSEQAVAEAKESLLSQHNLLKLSDGSPIINLKSELSFGIYYLTLMNEEEEAYTFVAPEQVIRAYQNQALEVHAPVKTRFAGREIITTPGRILFNQLLPKGIGFVNEVVDRGKVNQLLAKVFELHGEVETANLVDKLKEFSLRYATQSGLSWSYANLKAPRQREELVARALENIDRIDANYSAGLMTPRERYSQIVSIWQKVESEMTDLTMQELKDEREIKLFIDSGSYGVTPQTARDLAGWRGLMVDSTGRIQETPVRSGMIEGLTSHEEYLNTVGGRKSMIDVALMTARAGYLTRRLVDAVHDVLTREVDCGTKVGLLIKKQADDASWPMLERITGRVLQRDVVDAKGKVILPRGELITRQLAEQILAAGVSEVEVRSPLTCATEVGVCSKCYGADMATRGLVSVGEAVGVVAAQSIGEPGTQLTLHSKHRAGAAVSEITQGLPRVEELFEARTPKVEAEVTDLSGTVSAIEEKDEETLVVVVEAEEIVEGKKVLEERRYEIPATAKVVVQVGQIVTAGDSLTEGNLDIDVILDLKGILAAQMYLLREIQQVYRSQGVDVHDKHIEIIIRKMSRSVRVVEPGDSTFLPGELLTWYQFRQVNERLEKEGKEPARGRRTISGISKVALLTDSWLSAASFEETPNVLAAASVNERPQVDHLLGLKENVIIGRLIPTGERVKGVKAETD